MSFDVTTGSGAFGFLPGRFDAVMWDRTGPDPMLRGLHVMGHRLADTNDWIITSVTRDKEEAFGTPVGPMPEEACRTFLMMLPKS